MSHARCSSPRFTSTSSSSSSRRRHPTTVAHTGVREGGGRCWIPSIRLPSAGLITLIDRRVRPGGTPAWSSEDRGGGGRLLCGRRWHAEESVWANEEVQSTDWWSHTYCTGTLSQQRRQHNTGGSPSTQFLWPEVIRAWENDNQVCGHPLHTSRSGCSVSRICTFFLFAWSTAARYFFVWSFKSCVI